MCIARPFCGINTSQNRGKTPIMRVSKTMTFAIDPMKLVVFSTNKF